MDEAQELALLAVLLYSSREPSKAKPDFKGYVQLAAGFQGAALEHVKEEASKAGKKSSAAGPYSVKKSEPTYPE
jgi:hypothetical protein